MHVRTPGSLAVVVLGIGLLCWPRGLFLGNGFWFGAARHPLFFEAMEGLVFCVVYFGTLKFWELLTGVRLTVDCARILHWW